MEKQRIATYRRAIRSVARKVASYIRNWLTPERRKKIMFFLVVIVVFVVRSLMNEAKPASTIGTALTLIPDLLYAIS